MLDPVQERNHGSRRRLHALERFVEGRRLDRDEQEIDGLAQFRRHLGPRGLDVVGVLERQTVGRDHVGRARTSDANDANTGAKEANREHPADSAGPEHRDSGLRRHRRLGGTGARHRTKSVSRDPQPEARNDAEHGPTRRSGERRETGGAGGPGARHRYDRVT